MTNEDRPRFSTTIAALAATFDKQVDPALANGYWMALNDLSIEAVETAVAQALCKCKWMPKPVEIRRLAGIQPVDERSARAWERVLELASNCRAACHPDPIAERAIKAMGGWLSVGHRNSEELSVWGRKQFAELYEVLAESESVREAHALNEAPKPFQLVDGSERCAPAIAANSSRLPSRGRGSSGD